jgi:hypothetical protein
MDESIGILPCLMYELWVAKMMVWVFGIGIWDGIVNAEWDWDWDWELRL